MKFKKKRRAAYAALQPLSRLIIHDQYNTKIYGQNNTKIYDPTVKITRKYTIPGRLKHAAGVGIEPWSRVFHDTPLPLSLR